MAWTYGVDNALAAVAWTYGVDIWRGQCTSLEQLQNVMNSELNNLNDWLITNKLSLNIVKLSL